MTYHGHVQHGVVLLDDPASLPDGTEVSVRPVKRKRAPSQGKGQSTPCTDFWIAKSVSDLAEQQQVTPPDRIEALAGDWPEDESLDEFLETVRRNRA